MHRQRRIEMVAWLSVFLALISAAYPVYQSATSRAATRQQDGTAITETPVASPADASPVASPSAATPVASPSAATPVATTPASADIPTFVSGQWRISIAFAARANAIPELQLDGRSGRDWIVVVADVSNWSGERANFDPRKFGIRVAGDDKAGGFSQQLSEAAAEQLSLQAVDFDKGVGLSSGKTARLVAVFRIDSTGADPFLVQGDHMIPLTPAIARGGALLDLPEAPPLPELTEAEATGVPDGSSLELDDRVMRLSGIDAPVSGECFAGQAQRRLERLAGERVLVESGPTSDTIYAWTEDKNGIRSLINYEAIVGGSAAFLAGAAGPFAHWLQDGDRIARTKVAGLWGACTSVHGAGRNLEPETASFAIRSDGETRPYAVWVAWSPLIVTKPNGGAWVFFSAEATEGKDVSKKRLFSSSYDPSNGKWSTARAMQGGDVQMGPSAVVDNDGIVHLVYCDRAKDEDMVYSEIMYTHEDGNGGWVDPVPVAREPTSGYQLSPSLSIDKTGVLHVAWQDQRAFDEEARLESPSNADIFVSDLEPGGAWSKPVLINTHYVDAVSSRPQIVADGDRLIAVWSVYATSLGLDAAVRVEWSSRALDDPLAWSTPQPLVVGRGESFGGRLIDLEADPTGGVVLVYGRQANDTFLFLRRLKPGATEWGGDTLLTFGDRGTFPSVTISQEGVVYVVYNVGNSGAVDVGAVAIPYRSIQPGPEVVLTEDQPNTQGRPVVAADVTGRPWIVYFSEPEGGPADEVRILRNAEVPVVAEQ
jgi:hypothetical protein